VAVGIIMAGGKGERLWPLSRRSKPKQFLEIGGKSFLRRTVERVLPLFGWENLYCVIPEEFRELVLAEVPEIPERNLVIEPMGKNTAPCIGLAALAVSQRNPEEVMVVLPADHLLGEEERFREVLRFGMELAQEEWLVTLGIVPRSPHTGYGYIRGGEVFRKSPHFLALRALGFHEKPTFEVAQQYLAEGNYYWNSGMFCFRADVILGELSQHAPEIFKGLAALRQDFDNQTLREAVFARFPSVSIDYAVMEKSARILLVPVDIPWSDVGSFPALSQALGVDSWGNTVSGKYLGVDTRGCLFITRKPLFSLGVEDLVLIEAEDLIFVTTKKESEGVKRLLEVIKEREDFKGYL